MRVKTCVVAAVAVIAMIGTAAADEHQTWYAGVGVGETTLEFRINNGGVEQPIFPPNPAVSFDESEDLTKLFIGYKPIKFFAIEGSFLSAGDFTDVILESSPGAGDGFAVAADLSGYDLSVLGILPLIERRIELYARFGLQRDEFNIVIRDQVDPTFSGNVKERVKQTNRIYGAGVQVNFGSHKNIGVRLEANILDPKDNIDDLSEVLLGFVFGWGGQK